MTKTCGIDRSEAQHDVALVDDQARIVARARVSDDAAGFGQLLELLAEHGDGEPARMEIETDKGLFVAALVAAGFTLFSINPRAAARYRERHGQAGGNPIVVMRSCSPTSCALTGTSTGRCRPTPS